MEEIVHTACATHGVGPHYRRLDLKTATGDTVYTCMSCSSAVPNCAICGIKMIRRRSLVAGALADRVNRQRLMVTCDGAGASHDLIAHLDTLASRPGYQLIYSGGWEMGNILFTQAIANPVDVMHSIAYVTAGGVFADLLRVGAYLGAGA